MTKLGQNVRVLCLDGGGAKGVYTLGVLSGLEEVASAKLHTVFDAIYGVSTGSIIGALIAIGRPIADIHKLYGDGIPHILGQCTVQGRSTALARFAEMHLGDERFGSTLTRLAIVTLNRRTQRPLIFKSHMDMIYSGRESFKPGFGVKISRAICASSAAFPLFNPVSVRDFAGEECELIDGGFVSNNPSMLAISDALGPLGVRPDGVQIVSVGVGRYKVKQLPILAMLPHAFGRTPWRVVSEMMESSAQTMEFLRKQICAHVPAIRVDGDFMHLSLETNLLETRQEVLETLFDLGRQSFHEHKGQLIESLGLE
jgi:uncharacterized protein